MGNLQYSIFRYAPSLVSGETINLAAVFYYDETKYREFFSITKWKRVSNFDDTLNISLLKALMVDMRNEIGTQIDTPNFQLEMFCSQYNSEFYFDQCQTLNDISHQDLTKQIELVKRMYFQFEYDIEKRPSSEDQKKFLYHLLRSKSIEYTKDALKEGAYSDEIKYDYIVKNYGVVFFNFMSAQLNGNVMNKVKAWAWNAQNSDLPLKLIAVYDAEDETREDIAPAISILTKFAYRIFNINNGFDDVIKLLGGSAS